MLYLFWSLAVRCELKYRLQHSCPYAKEYRGHVKNIVKRTSEEHIWVQLVLGEEMRKLKALALEKCGETQSYRKESIKER